MCMGSRVGVRAVVKALVSASAPVLVLVLVLVGAGGAAYGQCDQWLPGSPLAGINGQVNAITAWDPDGPGPEHARLVAVGDFTVAGSALVQNIAVLDPQTQRWSGLGGQSGTSALTHAIGTPTGRLYVGSSSLSSNFLGGVSISRGVALYESNRWASVVFPFNVSSTFPPVTSFALAPNGDVLSLGDYNAISGMRFRGTAVLNALDFLPEFGGGSISVTARLPAYALLPLQDGDLLIAGDFDYLRSNSQSGESFVARNVMRMTPAGPQKLEKELNAGVTAAATLNDGRTILAGRFTSSGEVLGLNGLAIYDGRTFVPVAGNTFETGTSILSVAQHPGGDLYFAGSLVIKGKRHVVARISDGVLIPIGPTYTPPEVGLTTSYTPNFASGETTPPAILAIMPTGEVYFGGRYSPNGLPLINIARIVNDTFEPASPGVVGTVSTISSMPDGRFLVAGNFRTTADRRIVNIAAWDGIDLRYVAPDIGGPISGAATLPDGRIVATRRIQPTPFGVLEQRSFVLERGQWRQLLTGNFNGTNASNGDPAGTAAFRRADGTSFNAMARFNGDDFVQLSPPFESNTFVRTLQRSGQVLVARRTSASGQPQQMAVSIADGDRWKQLGPELSGEVVNIEQLPDGRPVALVAVATGSAMRVWNGASWLPFLTNPGGLSSASIRGLFQLAPTALSDAALDIVAFGRFSSASDGGSGSFAGIARYRAGVWSNLRGGLSIRPSRSASVSAVTRQQSGELLAVGDFNIAGTLASTLLARYTLTGIPTIARQPTAAAPTISANQTIEVTFTPSPGYSVQYVRWSRDGVPIFNGPGGASPDGGTVIGGSTDIITPTDGSPVSLLITGAQPSDSGRYAVTLFSACGQATSQDVAVRVNPAACSPADIATTDGQTGLADGGPDGAIDNGDFVAFFAAFFAGDGDPSRAAADIANADGATTLDGGGPDGAVTSADFTAFFALFFEGCGGGVGGA